MHVCKSFDETLPEGINFTLYLYFFQQICGRKIKATDFRRAKTTIGRRAGIDPKDLSRAMLHSTDVANRFYDTDILNNQSSLRKWISTFENFILDLLPNYVTLYPSSSLINAYPVTIQLE